MRYELDIPAYHNGETEEDVPRVVITMHVEVPLRAGEQIGTPDGGIVEIAKIRHRPFWTNGHEGMETHYGKNYAYDAGMPLAITNWVERPRRPVHHG